MTITELIEELESALYSYGNIEVMTSSNYGDFHRTEQLDSIQSVEVCTPIETGYSNSGLAFPSEDEPEETETPDEKEQILVLRYTC